MEWERAGSPYTKDQTGLTSDEKIVLLFQPDTLLSAQYFESVRRKDFLEIAALEGEKIYQHSDAKV
jgi:hypothetical protein